MREHKIPAYDSELGNILITQKNNIVFEGREELYIVLTSLRHSKNPKARALSRQFLRVHLNLHRCPRCGSLRRKIIRIFFMGWKEVCVFCDRQINEEHERIKRREMKAKIENDYWHN